jgi:hypothetical protein
VTGTRDEPAVFSTGAGRAFVERVCRSLGVSPSRFEERNFEDG